MAVSISLWKLENHRNDRWFPAAFDNLIGKVEPVYFWDPAIAHGGFPELG